MLLNHRIDAPLTRRNCYRSACSLFVSQGKIDLGVSPTFFQKFDAPAGRRDKRVRRVGDTELEKL